jgi:hypothetical protein
LKEQTDYNAHETNFVPAEKMPEGSRYFMYQDVFNAGGTPSEQVIEDRIQSKGSDYRQELAGPHPVERFRAVPSKGKKARQQEETRV